MRDTGYRDAAAALAEIIDNSVQAQATRVEVLIAEKEMRVVSKASWQADRIAVLDNGTGMTSEVLIAALQFGNGAYKQDHSGIGKFGMGLPQSSISQCRRVDVWTWQNGPENAIHTFLDIDAIEGGNLDLIADLAFQAWVESPSHNYQISKDAYWASTVSTMIVYNKSKGEFRLTAVWLSMYNPHAFICGSRYSWIF